MGCPIGGCDGYELTTDLDFDTDDDGDIDANDYVDLDGNGTKDTDEDAIIWNGGDGWNPIQNYSAILEGNQYEIKNLFIDRSFSSAAGSVGLIGTISTLGTVRNLYLTGVDVTGENSGTSNVFVSALAAWNQGTISDSYVTGSVTAKQTNASGGVAYAGGFTGNNAAGTIRKSYSSANVTATATGSSDAIAGGLLAWNLSGTVEASYATGNVSVTGSTNTGSEIDAGGLVGRNNLGTIRAVYATGNVSATAGYTVDIGGLVGHNTAGSTVTVAWSKGAVTSTGTPDNATVNDGGSVGKQDGTVTYAYWDTDVSGIADDTDNTAPEGKTTSELQTPTETQKSLPSYPTGIYANWNVNVDGVTGNDNPWDFGTSSQYPVLHVRTLPHSLLQGVPTVTWAVSNATLCESTAGTNTNACGTGASTTSTTITPTLSAAWKTDISYTIPANAAYTSSKAKLTIPAGDTTVTGATLTAVNNKLDAADNVLNLTPLSSHLRQASSVPAITIKDDDIPKPTGFKLSVDGTKVQLDWTEVSLADSYTLQQSTSSTFATKTDIPISSGSTVTHKITSGLTSGTTYYFRLIAEATGYDDSAPSETVSATPTTGDVDYDADDDGLIEVKTLAQFNAIRWDLDGDGAGDKYDSNNDGDYTDTGEYDYTSNYTGVFSSAEDNMGCNETAASISSQNTGNPSCTGYELAANLDFDTDGDETADSGDTYWNGGKGWDPIGGTSGSAYTGDFDGQTYTISNLYIDRTTGNYAGLFAYLNGASGTTIENVSLINVDVTFSPTAAGGGAKVYTGGLAGRVGSGVTIEGSYTTGRVRAGESATETVTFSLALGSSYVGGLAGDLDGAIVSSYSHADVTAYTKSTAETILTMAGGLVGRVNTGGSITASYARGAVAADMEAKNASTVYAGGLAGYLSGNVRASYARGAVSADYDATDTSGVTGSAYAGGLLGLQAANITASYSTGAPAATGDGTTGAGGLVGSRISGTTANSLLGHGHLRHHGHGAGHGQDDQRAPDAHGLRHGRQRHLQGLGHRPGHHADGDPGCVALRDVQPLPGAEVRPDAQRPAGHGHAGDFADHDLRDDGGVGRDGLRVGQRDHRDHHTDGDRHIL